MTRLNRWIDAFLWFAVCPLKHLHDWYCPCERGTGPCVRERQSR